MPDQRSIYDMRTITTPLVAMPRKPEPEKPLHRWCQDDLVKAMKADARRCYVAGHTTNHARVPQDTPNGGGAVPVERLSDKTKAIIQIAIDLSRKLGRPISSAEVAEHFDATSHRVGRALFLGCGRQRLRCW